MTVLKLWYTLQQYENKQHADRSSRLQHAGCGMSWDQLSDDVHLVSLKLQATGVYSGSLGCSPELHSGPLWEHGVAAIRQSQRSIGQIACSSIHCRRSALAGRQHSWLASY